MLCSDQLLYSSTCRPQIPEPASSAQNTSLSTEISIGISLPPQSQHDVVRREPAATSSYIHMEDYMRKLCFQLWLPLVLALAHSSAHAQADMDRRVLASGGVNAANAVFHVVGTLGQPIVGSVMASHHSTWQGFWYAEARTTSSSPVPGLETASLSCTPNPIAGPATVNFVIPRSGNVTITMHDLLGRTVQTLESGVRQSGSFSVELDTEGLPGGRYTIRYQHSSGEQALPVLIVK